MTEFSFTRIGSEWGVRVWDGPGGNLEDETVTITTKAGKEKEVKLGSLVSSDRKVQIYEIAAAPKKEDEQPLPGPDVVPDGRYAFPVEDDEWMFVRIWRGTRNPNVVRAYVIATQTGDLDKGEATDVKDALDRIVLLGAAKSAQEFGWRTGHCGRCGDELSNNLSRKLGTGPVCMKRLWSNTSRLALMAEAREELRAVGLDPQAKYDSLSAA